MEDSQRANLEVDGKFFRLAGERVFLRVVTYGPFFAEEDAGSSSWNHRKELRRIREAGFHGIRIYTSPSQDLLDSALEEGLLVMVGLAWSWSRVFRGGVDESVFTEARLQFTAELARWGNHPAVAAVYVANEIPVDVVRWMGGVEVRKSLELLIEDCWVTHPHLLYAYASFPSTEYLEPENADFTAMNVYLEDPERYRSYLARLHNVAGDRPVMISEFGADSLSLGEGRQAELLLWAYEESFTTGCAGFSAYAWSDVWWNHGALVEGWMFGLTRSDGSSKCALDCLSGSFLMTGRDRQQFQRAEQPQPKISVIVCTYNGAKRVEACLDALTCLEYSDYEVLVVDDGSTDATREIVATYSSVKLISQKANRGLSAARNLGARSANGEILAYTDDDCQPDKEWLFWLARGFRELGCDACGGPNLPPRPMDANEAIVNAAPGAPSHVLIGDQEAEHLPGCHLAVKREAFEAIGGFNEDFWIAGDDVDFCWRLEEAGFRLGFHGASFVWHRRRTTLWNYGKQQWNYGKAEALLMRDHPNRFSRGGGARWQGKVYLGGPLMVDDNSVIYQGKMGSAPYAQVVSSMLPRRPLHRDFCSIKEQLLLAGVSKIQPWLRYVARTVYSLPWRYEVPMFEKVTASGSDKKWRYQGIHEAALPLHEKNQRLQWLEYFVELGFQPCSDTSIWDLERQGEKILLVCEELGTQCWQLRIRYNGLLSTWNMLLSEMN